MFFADVQAMLHDGFKFHQYIRSVIDNWEHYDGKGKPPFH